MARRSNLLPSVWFVLVIILFTGLVAVLSWFGFFRIGGNDANAKVVAAALALVGAIIGAVVSVAGLLLKHSIDERNSDLRSDAEKRLKLEAAVRTLQLFSTATGDPTPKDQRDGALFALSSLRQYELTLVIVESLIEKDDLRPNLFTTLLNDAILNGASEIKDGAVTLYHRYADRRVLIPHGIAVPRALLYWEPGLPEYVREQGASAVAKAIMARPLAEWMERDLRYSFNTALGILCRAWEDEGDERLREGFAAILSPLSGAMPDRPYLYHPGRKINIAKIKTEVIGAEANSDYIKDLAAQLSDWVKLKDGEKQVSERTQSKDSDKQVSEPEPSKNSNKQRRAHRQGR